MAGQKGSLSINSENIFPIIKKWMYSDQDIFYRELISNGCDAITKRKKLDVMGEASLPDDFKARIDVVISPDQKTIQIKDNGLGMTEDEVSEYINQIAFSGAADFLEKYKDKGGDEQIIGHFGLGFYSAFMVADEVHIDTLSYKEGAEPVHWECDGGTEYSMEKGERAEVGTTITLYLNEDCLKYCNEYEARSVIQKYCSFMPTEIYLSVDKEEVVEEGKEPEKKEPQLLNDPTPLWTKNPSECTREEYLEFYRKVFLDYKEPLFWIHLNMDYPFNLKGILYFPKINMEYESIEGKIKLYNNQVFIADNIKEVIPEFLMLLKGVIDCPDLPLNVSRSALQNDGFVKKISDYITKKVADKLSGMCKTEKEEYEKYWDDISPFIKYGCLKDEKFAEKMNNYILFKNLDKTYLTLPECLELNPEEEVDEEGNPVEHATDENGEKVEAEVVDEKKDDKKDDKAEGEKKKEVTIYYVTDEVQQSQYINMFKQAKMDAVLLPDSIDQPFIQRLEMQNEGVHFKRIDADIESTLKNKTSKKAAEELEAAASKITDLMKKAIKKEKLTIKVEKLKNKKIASMLTVSEESRRMQDMMKMYASSGLDMGAMGGDETLILNANHPLVQFVMEHDTDENAKMFCEQLYDLAKLQNAPLSPEDMTKFISRSNDIMMMLTK